MVYSFVTMYCIIRTIINNKLHTSLSTSYDFRSLWISWGSYRWSVYSLDSLKTNNKAVVHRRQRRRGCRGRDPPIFHMQGSSCVDDLPPIFWQVFYFFPSAGVLNTASRCHFHLQCAQCTVLIQQLNKTAFEWQLAYLQPCRSLGTNWYFYKVEQNPWDTWILKTTHLECTISHHFEMKN